MAILVIRGATQRFAGHKAVDSVSRSIAAGQFCTLHGPSGYGKMTRLRRWPEIKVR